MPLHQFTPKGKFTRVYFHLPAGSNPMQQSQLRVWEAIKRQHLHIDEGHEVHYFEDPEDEAIERSSWFAGWNDPACWDIEETIFIDSHY